MLYFYPVLTGCAWAAGGVDAFANHECLECHDGRKEIEVPDVSPYAQEGNNRALVAIVPAKYAKGIHARLKCMDCHGGITNLHPPHQIGSVVKVDCAACHESIAKSRPVAERETALGVHLLRNIETYRLSFHARPNKDNPEFVNATCHECHDSHFFNVSIEDRNNPAYVDWRQSIPKLCGKCHEDEIADYEDSVHSVELKEKGNVKAATCIDCHTSHEITGALRRSFKLESLDRCGACHNSQLATYRTTFHGQMTRFNYVHTARCSDCHSRHKILSVKDERSSTHANNRLKTCQKCHDGERIYLATVGFSSYNPHAHSKDLARFPQVWIFSRLMDVLIWSVIGFFSVHSCLWYYREWREGRGYKRDLPCSGNDPSMHVRRFSLGWRFTHMLITLFLIVLLFTGVTFMNADSNWAPEIVRIFGGVEKMRLTHRIAAGLFVSTFVHHIILILQRLVRNRKFQWFGPESLLPNKVDFSDCVGMFRWFFGKGEKPKFDRWTYFEKFGYWAVFWGVIVTGLTGVVLAFPHVAGQYFAGWIFNVALLIHAKEAFLATVFLFVFHIFHNHFRPEKQKHENAVMFTGIQSCIGFQLDHMKHYERLVSMGELGNNLVDAPSSAKIIGAKILNLILIGVGLILLTMMCIAYFEL
ncbi:MAG: cytochrome c3 family protein [Magnetococcales bacterium]|nr:cytochrome c3 family protein [Magnetococcales bacterium]